MVFLIFITFLAVTASLFLAHSYQVFWEAVEDQNLDFRMHGWLMDASWEEYQACEWAGLQHLFFFCELCIRVDFLEPRIVEQAIVMYSISII